MCPQMSADLVLFKSINEIEMDIIVKKLLCGDKSMRGNRKVLGSLKENMRCLLLGYRLGRDRITETYNTKPDVL